MPGMSPVALGLIRELKAGTDRLRRLAHHLLLSPLVGGPQLQCLPLTWSGLPALAMESLELLAWVLEGPCRVQVPQRVGPTFLTSQVSGREKPPWVGKEPGVLGPGLSWEVLGRTLGPCG